MSSTELSDVSPARSSGPVLIARLTQEMAQRWRNGDRPPAEEFFARHRELYEQPAAAAELIYEEFCLRRERCEAVGAHEFLERFPQWRYQLAVLLECAQVLDSSPAATRWPQIGETIGDFQLLAELGRGAMGRVYLATQPHLADRPVVLKVTPGAGREHLSLARLQHTHIVPLYSVQQEAARELLVLCMPYFGGMTLARLLDMFSDRPAQDHRGLDILQALDKVQAAAVVAMPARGPAWQFLAHAAYVQAICSMGACLADALDYAHARGLVHLDLKPSNVLITFDGQPMLLDFHLAREPVPAGASAAEWLGGTVGYMSPEQQLAVAAVRAGTAVPEAVDDRSDVYSLGLILYQSLGGPVPLPSSPYDSSPKRERASRNSLPSLTLRANVEPPRLDRYNPNVSKGLADVIAKCLARDPRDRYADAASLAADLRRHLADLPLHGVANRSFSERWCKWRRRRPHALPLVVMILAVFAAAAAVGILARSNVAQRFDEARAALNEGVHELDEHRYADSVATLKRALAATESLPRSQELATQISQHLHRAERAQLVDDFNNLADQLRLLHASDLTPSHSLRVLETRCRDLWSKRNRIAEYLGSDARHEFGDRVQSDLLDVAILWSDLHVRLAAPGEIEAARHESLQVLDEAESLDNSSPILFLERRIHAAALGLAADAAVAGSRASEFTARTPWEHFAIGRFHLGRGDLEQAAKEFDQAIALQPNGMWPNFYTGVCAYRLGRHDDAIVAFTACIGAAPDRPTWFYNRALAYTALGRLDRARRDYDQAIRLDPHFAEAAFNRGILHLREHRHADAIADLERALADGASPAAVHYNLALVYVAQRDYSSAQSSVQNALRHEPAHKDARDLQDRLVRER